MPQDTYQTQPGTFEVPAQPVLLAEGIRDAADLHSLGNYPLADMATQQEKAGLLGLRGERQSEPVLGRAQAGPISLHQRLNGFYRNGFTGQWQSYAVNGAFSILAGVISLILPVFLDGSVLACAGGILLARGTLALIFTLSAPVTGALATSLLPSLLYLSAGICLMFNLFTESSGLILFFSLYFIATGIATILFAVVYRSQYSGHWEWLLVSGVLNLDLALISLSRLPEHFVWILTIFLGLDLIAHGSALLALALTSNDDTDRRARA